MVIDTNIFIEYLRAKNKLDTTLQRLSDQYDWHVSSITIYELFMGANTEKKKEEIKILTSDLILLPFTYDTAMKSAEIYNDLKIRNQIIEFRDIFIGATAIVNNFSVLTLNTKHFERIDGIKIYEY
jgi:tRNA(fMet)-specific endonuclease VapC